MNSYTSGSNKTIMMTVENVTQGDESFYKCKSEDGMMESAESWLSVLTNQGKLKLDQIYIHIKSE